MLNVVYDPYYMTLFSRKNTISEENSFMTLFLFCSYFRAHPTTLLLKILGGRMHGPSPTSNFGGPSPSPLGLRPCHPPYSSISSLFSSFFCHLSILLASLILFHSFFFFFLFFFFFFVFFFFFFFFFFVF